MIRNILITAIGGDISQGVATILRENRPDIKLVGVDMQNQHGGRMFVDQYALVPPASNKNYKREIQKLIKLYSIDAIIPMSEPELSACLPFEDLANGVKWITSGNKVVAVGLDKLETIRAISNLGLSVPWTQIVADGEITQFPCVLKNRFGSGSRNVSIAQNIMDFNYWAQKYPEGISQELLEPADQEVTCAVYRDRAGKIATLLMLRKLTGGLTSWAKVIYDTQALELCEKIAIGLDLKGSMNIQMRLTVCGPRVFEINPRFSSTVLMRHRIGFSDVLWTISEAEGKPIHYPHIQGDIQMARTQGAIILDKVSSV